MTTPTCETCGQPLAEYRVLDQSWSSPAEYTEWCTNTACAEFEETPADVRKAVARDERRYGPDDRDDRW